MKQIKKIHHSLGDWDYRVGALLRLDSSQYISSPTSLQAWASAAVMIKEWIILKPALASCVPDGRLVSWARIHEPSWAHSWYIFRVQALPTNQEPANCYEVRVYAASVALVKRVNNSNTFLRTGATANPLGIDTWQKQRVTFFQHILEDLSTTFRIIYEVEVAGEWVEQFHYDDTENKWADSVDNRLGLLLNAAGPTDSTWVDDTEVWKKAL